MPAATSRRLGVRFDVDVPGCVGTTFQRRTSSASASSSSTRWTTVAVASVGPDPVSWRSDVNGMPETRAPRYPGASPTRTSEASARRSRYRRSRLRRSGPRGPWAYWLNVAPIRAQARRATKASSSFRGSSGTTDEPYVRPDRVIDWARARCHRRADAVRADHRTGPLGGHRTGRDHGGRRALDRIG